MTRPNIDSYDFFVVAFSGGKDSLACLLHLFDLGVPREKIELWHHEVDGREGIHFMDWPVTADYCRKVAQALKIPLYFSWLEGGFARELVRDQVPKAPTHWETPEGTVGTTGGKGPPGYRKQFPMAVADLGKRWCSAYLKIDVGAAALRNQERFNHARTLMITGERAEESTARENYNELEPDRADGRDGRERRHVDRWRPVHKWLESQVWEIIQRYGVNPHPAYHLGWGRVSCAACIFGNMNQWASLRHVNPKQFEVVANVEHSSGKTIQTRKDRGSKRHLTVIDMADRGEVYPAARDRRLIKLATSFEYTDPVLLPKGKWKLPAGAYAESDGPT